MKHPKLLDEKFVIETARHDPVFFANYFLSEELALTRKIPFFHRAIMAIMTREVEFLETYGELDKIVENFPKQFFFNEQGKICLRYTKHTAITIPRGFGKTLVTQIIALWNI